MVIENLSNDDIWNIGSRLAGDINPKLHLCKYVAIMQPLNEKRIWDIKKWLTENAEGHWYYTLTAENFSQFAKRGRRSVFHFQELEDKVMFALKWM